MLLEANGKIGIELFELTGWMGEDMRYTLGYLVRKMPDKRFKLRNFHKRGWSAQYSFDLKTPIWSDVVNSYVKKMEYMEEAETPEDAVCKLLIKLIKENIVDNVEEEEL